ncbi:hypothetical protein AB6L78_002798 [Listeria monocytogenes]|nr:hypothetical protein [Listeria monocytogenes]EHM3340657.1 hypothetical protein [Listeria monocytogenes]EHM3395701.1 hypothetical protein [Listeria monocytogenes]EKJ1381259.1 hypothetical protein [Listeria monocytogenes]
METMMREYRENITILKKALQEAETEVEQTDIRAMIADLAYGIRAIKRASKVAHVVQKAKRPPVTEHQVHGSRDGLLQMDFSISTKRRYRPRKRTSIMSLAQFLRIREARVSTFQTHGVAQDYRIDKSATQTDPKYVGRAIRMDTRESISLVRLYYQLRNVRTLDNQVVLAKRKKPQDVVQKVQLPVRAHRRKRA